MPLTLAAFLGYGIIYSQELFNAEGDLIELVGGIFNLLTFTGADFPIVLTVILNFVIYVPWAYVLYDLISEAVPG